MNDSQADHDNQLIRIVPSAARYAEPLEVLQRIIYDMEPDDNEGILLAEHCRHHLEIFP
ncbi:MAG: hypothetical protein GYB67_03715, partial [Chloroflexi bacterium]|nr:hypothetical protein [Chloroflexota bacterium]